MSVISGQLAKNLGQCHKLPKSTITCNSGHCETCDLGQCKNTCGCFNCVNGQCDQSTAENAEPAQSASDAKETSFQLLTPTVFRYKCDLLRGECCPPSGICCSSPLRCENGSCVCTADPRPSRSGALTTNLCMRMPFRVLPQRQPHSERHHLRVRMPVADADVYPRGYPEPHHLPMRVPHGTGRLQQPLRRQDLLGRADLERGLLLVRVPGRVSRSVAAGASARPARQAKSGATRSVRVNAHRTRPATRERRGT